MSGDDSGDAVLGDIDNGDSGDVGAMGESLVEEKHDSAHVDPEIVQEALPDESLKDQLKSVEDDAMARGRLAAQSSMKKAYEETAEARKEASTARDAVRLAQQEAKRAREEAQKLKESRSSSSPSSTVSRTEIVREYVPSLPVFSRYSLVPSPYSSYKDELDKTIMKHEVKNQVKKELAEEMKLKPKGTRVSEKRIVVKVVPAGRKASKSKTRSKSKGKSKKPKTPKKK